MAMAALPLVSLGPRQGEQMSADADFSLDLGAKEWGIII